MIFFRPLIFINNQYSLLYFAGSHNKEPIPMSDEEALSFLVNNDFSKAQYKEMRMTAQSHNCPIYPDYNKVREAKSKCLPPNIEITELKASVPLQDLLNHTVFRLLKTQEEVLLSRFHDTTIDTEVFRGTLISKWGFDGATGQMRLFMKNQFYLPA